MSVNIASSAGVIGGWSGIPAITSALSTASADMPSSVIRDPTRWMSKRAGDCAADAAEIERRERVARVHLREAGGGQHRHDPAEADVDGEQAEKEGAAQPQRVAAQQRCEQLAHRSARADLVGGAAARDERGFGSDVVPEPAQQRDELRPPFAARRQVLRRLGQQLEQHGGDDQRDHAAGDEQRAPAVALGESARRAAPPACRRAGCRRWSG